MPETEKQETPKKTEECHDLSNLRYKTFLNRLNRFKKILRYYLENFLQ